MLGPEPPEPRDLVEQMYCAEQIYIPPTYPYILKNWIKAAIRTQPYDLLKWSATYFRALAEHREPPVKSQMEYPNYENEFLITPGFLRILAIQFRNEPEVEIQSIWKRWDGICLPLDGFQRAIQVGLFHGITIPTAIFIGIVCGLISVNLVSTMVLFCESMTKEPEGGSASIPFELFKETYIYLARLDNGPEPKPPSPVPSNIDFSPTSESEKKTYEEREEFEEYVQCPGSMQDVNELSVHEYEGPFLSWSDSTLEPDEETMGQRYCKEVMRHLINYVFRICELREKDGIAGLTDYEADYKMIYPIVDSILKIVLPDPSPSELSWTSTYTVTLDAEEGGEECIKPHFHVPGIGPRVSYIQIEQVLDFLKDWANRQEGMILTRNLRHVLCPPLDAQFEEFYINNDTSGVKPCPIEKCKTI